MRSLDNCMHGIDVPLAWRVNCKFTYNLASPPAFCFSILFPFFRKAFCAVVETPQQQQSCLCAAIRRLRYKISDLDSKQKFQNRNQIALQPLHAIKWQQSQVPLLLLPLARPSLPFLTRSRPFFIWHGRSILISVWKLHRIKTS